MATLNAQTIAVPPPMEEPHYSLCDLFVSIQGEGSGSGRPMLFLRFWGCPLACPWCDEPKHRDPDQRRDLSLTELLAEMERIGQNLPSILLTGGEPLAVPFLDILIDHLKKRGIWLAMESSGVGGPIPDGLDWLTLSPKTRLNPDLMMRADELKFIIGANPSPQQRQEVDHWAARHPNVWLQPQAEADHPNPRAIAHCLDWVLASRGTLRLSTQVHKYLNIP